jgi:formiminotetrahydrofolate cyclodeaminase
MISYNNDSLMQYLEKLSLREPVPGGGSAAAVSGALGAALIAMSARYSLAKGKSVDIEKKISNIIAQVDAARLELIELAGKDAQAYRDLVSTRKAGDKDAHEKAKLEAARVPQDIIDLCQSCLKLTLYLYQEGNPHLVSDVKAAEAFLNAGIEAARHMQEANS